MKLCIKQTGILTTRRISIISNYAKLWMKLTDTCCVITSHKRSACDSSSLFCIKMWFGSKTQFDLTFGLQVWARIKGGRKATMVELFIDMLRWRYEWAEIKAVESGTIRGISSESQWCRGAGCCGNIQSGRRMPEICSWHLPTAQNQVRQIWKEHLRFVRSSTVLQAFLEFVD